MQEATATADFPGLARLSHWLKGAGGTTGFPAFTQPAKQLERLIHDEEYGEIAAVVAELLQLAQRLAVSRTERQGAEENA